MNKIGIIKSLAVIFLASILFMPVDSHYWELLLFLGLLFSVFWFIKS